MDEAEVDYVMAVAAERAAEIADTVTAEVFVLVMAVLTDLEGSVATLAAHVDAADASGAAQWPGRPEKRAYAARRGGLPRKGWLRQVGLQ
jgi:hypothetical protein